MTELKINISKKEKGYIKKTKKNRSFRFCKAWHALWLRKYKWLVIRYKMKRSICQNLRATSFFFWVFIERLKDTRLQQARIRTFAQESQQKKLGSYNQVRNKWRGWFRVKRLIRKSLIFQKGTPGENLKTSCNSFQSHEFSSAFNFLVRLSFKKLETTCENL